MEKEKLEDIYLTRKNIMLTTRVLLYCTKAKPFLFENKTDDNQVVYNTWRLGNLDCWRISHKKVLNGKIVAECEVETEEIRLWGDEIENYFGNNEEISIEKDSCLNFEQIEQYLCSNDYKGYALHISNLKIFDKPLSICEFDLKTLDRSKETPQNPKDHSLSNTVMHIERKNNKLKSKFEVLKPINKAPQNMCSVFKVDSKNYEKKYYVLISIRPEWLCKILNGEKTIEVRKKVLKEML